jgi:hypothetical protein
MEGGDPFSNHRQNLRGTLPIYVPVDLTRAFHEDAMRVSIKKVLSDRFVRRESFSLVAVSPEGGDPFSIRVPNV